MKDLQLIRLTNASGASVLLSNLGAGILEVIVPDKFGNMADVALGYANPADYMADGPGMGKTPGRYANRIAGGRLTIDGRDYQLDVNLPPNHLHGGAGGFQNRLWRVVARGNDYVEMLYRSADGEMGYPGTVDASVTYRWTDSNELQITYRATTDAPTAINLTNHAYWNLDGHDAGTALGQVLQLNASHYLPTDPTLVPTGALDPVAGTPMDFTQPKALGRDIHTDFPALNFGKGYDSCWALDGLAGTMRVAAVLTAAQSGRRLVVSTDQPGVQVYTGNWLSGCPAGKSGHAYADYDGVAIECQNFPDAPNHPAFPSAILRPADLYTRQINYKFEVGTN